MKRRIIPKAEPCSVDGFDEYCLMSKEGAVKDDDGRPFEATIFFLANYMMGEAVRDGKTTEEEATGVIADVNEVACGGMRQALCPRFHVLREQLAAWNAWGPPADLPEGTGLPQIIVGTESVIITSPYTKEN